MYNFILRDISFITKIFFMQKFDYEEKEKKRKVNSHLFFFVNPRTLNLLFENMSQLRFLIL